MGRHRRHGRGGGVDAGYEFLTFFCHGLKPAQDASIFRAKPEDAQLAAGLPAFQMFSGQGVLISVT